MSLSVQVQLGFTRLQARVRARQLRHRYEQQRVAVVVLQARARGCLARRAWTWQRQAVVLLQAHTRGMLARKTVHKMKRDVRPALCDSSMTACVCVCVCRCYIQYKMMYKSCV